MNEGTGPDGSAGTDPGEPSVSPGGSETAAARAVEGGEELAPSEAFQTLASEVRVAVLVELLAAERAGETPVAFSTLQSAADSASSAGFAYHLRQLSGHFVRGTDDGYVLTPAGRRAAEAVVDGTFTGNGRAS